MTEYNDRMKWVRQLKVGDLVCDCRYKHVRIKELKPLRVPWMPRIIRQIIFSDILSDRVSDALDDAWEKLMDFLNIKEIYDYNVVTEDGFGCSAFNCLGPADHNEEDHKENHEIQG